MSKANIKDKCICGSVFEVELECDDSIATTLYDRCEIAYDKWQGYHEKCNELFLDKFELPSTYPQSVDLANEGIQEENLSQQIDL